MDQAAWGWLLLGGVFLLSGVSGAVLWIAGILSAVRQDTPSPTEATPPHDGTLV